MAAACGPEARRQLTRVVDPAAPSAIPIYAALAMRRVYGASRAGQALRATVLSMAYATLVGLAIVTLAPIALLA